MHEILRTLPEGSVILDLGSGAGSFDADGYPFHTIRVDRAASRPQKNITFVQADAAKLPFRERVFDAVICNHCLEHFEEIDAALREIGRVVREEGSLYAAVPDSSTVGDILYRWMARGGGHVNRFASVDHLCRLIEGHTGLPHLGTRLLLTSFCFFNKVNALKPRPRKLLLLGGGNEYLLLTMNYFFRIADRFLSTRLSQYGWAVYFGKLRGNIDRQVWSNVCVRCGAGHPSQYLASLGHLSRRFLFLRFYSCPGCSAWNVFTRDEL